MATQTAETVGKLGKITKHIPYGGKKIGEVIIDGEVLPARADTPREEFFVGDDVKIVDQVPGVVYVERV